MREVGSGIFMYDTWHVSVVVVKSTHSTGVQKTSEWGSSSEVVAG